MNPRPLAYLDVETTGLSPWFGDRICEIAILRCEGELLVDSFSSLLNPERLLSPGAARVNGLRDAELQRAPRFSEVVDRVLPLLEGAVIVCHNAPFDLGFLSSELKRLGRPLPALRMLDTLELARQHFHFASNSLQAIAQALQIEAAEAHRARGDTDTTRQVLQYFRAQLGAQKIESAIRPYGPPLAAAAELSLPPLIEEALRGSRRLFIRYVDGKGDVSERWVTPKQVLALQDYVYLVSHCHLREAERNFRLDRIEPLAIEETQSP